jgi:hypothetical protein
MHVNDHAHGMELQEQQAWIDALAFANAWSA